MAVSSNVDLATAEVVWIRYEFSKNLKKTRKIYWRFLHPCLSHFAIFDFSAFYITIPHITLRLATGVNFISLVKTANVSVFCLTLWK
jgi:hypothetical protein